LRDLTAAVCIQQHRAHGIANITLAFGFSNPTTSAFDECQRITPTGLEQHGVKMEVAAMLLMEPAYQRPIGAFAVPLTAEEDRPPLRSRKSMSSHPRRGTAPYTPPRYFR
jgi:hypothetical protein